jgi:DNA-binding Lrp family transcriptional regulator
MKTLIDLLRENARLTNEQLAVLLDKTPEEVAAEIKKLEDDGMIVGYSAIINEEKFDKNSVTAFITLKVSPKSECGYNDVADTISQFPEVDSVHLMSGSFDLAITIRGMYLREIAMFVLERLAPMEGVLSTSTHFILQRYKEKGISFNGGCKDERGLVSP